MLNNDTIKATPQVSFPQNQIWPGDWYIFNSGKLEGPFSAEDAFKPKMENNYSLETLISKRGFTQWYPYFDLADLFRLTEEYSKRTLLELNRTPSPTLAKTTLGPEQESIKQVSEGKVALPVTEPLQTEKATNYEKKLAQPTLNKKKPLAKNVPSQHDDYFSIKGPLRLGKIASPFFSAFCKFPSTLGISWFYWFRNVTREVSWHLSSNFFPKNFPPFWLTVVPGIHIYMTYKLAKYIREIEAQNQYKSISPWIAAGLSIFPPFAILYLQRAVNRHWRLHVRHVLWSKNISK